MEAIDKYSNINITKVASFNYKKIMPYQHPYNGPKIYSKAGIAQAQCFKLLQPVDNISFSKGQYWSTGRNAWEGS